MPTNLNFDKSSYLIALILGTSFFSLFLKPLSTFITGLIRNRFTWLKISYFFAFIITVTQFFIQENNIILFIFLSLFLAICISSSSIFFLYYNEQFNYRIYVISVTWIIFTFITFGTILGNYISEINHILLKEKYEITSLSIFVIILIYLFIYSFFCKETKNLAGVFDEYIIENLPKKNNFNFFILYLLGFLISLTSALNNSQIVKLFIGLNLKDYGSSYETIESFLRSFNYFYYVPSIIVSYFIYKFVLKYLGQKYLIITCLFLLFGVYTLLAFTTNPYIYMFSSILSGILCNQIIFTLFSLCIFWNYRAPKNPVTGFFGTSLFLAKFLVESIEKFISKSNYGVFKDINDLSDLSFYDVANSTSLKDFDIATTLIMSFSCMVVLISVLIFYYKNNSLFADYLNYRNATRNIKNLLKKRMLDKVKTKIDVNKINSNDINEYN
ncbi:hypothetical protein STURON_00877 [Spiroplasma turonicum]|uniref:Uncharacterized protein n=2 Tax=Spiroplasma turonicum TaxID=216946 RepID=A0A0K1P769_9MOLU|nr:O-antigen polymerase [Spiroplasma turonicum]AKU80123.1 hypothetical protein STURON_00877 [Spiroplasma turonicum]